MRFISLDVSVKWMPIVIFALSLGACSSSKEFKFEEKPIKKLYIKARHELEVDENYEKAARHFEEVERQHPYSTWATQALLNAAYAYYLGGFHDDALGVLNRFIELNPAHRDIAYAYYLKALSFYAQIRDASRDQSMTRHAKEAFEELVKRFPASKYTRDARLKLDLVNDRLAEKEMRIGRFYSDRKEFGASLKRFETVVRDYQTTVFTPEALHRLVECYLNLGNHQEALIYGAWLGHNFRHTKWYQYSYAMLKKHEMPIDDGGSWIRRYFNKIL